MYPSLLGQRVKAFRSSSSPEREEQGTLIVTQQQYNGWVAQTAGHEWRRHWNQLGSSSAWSWDYDREEEEKPAKTPGALEPVFHPCQAGCMLVPGLERRNTGFLNRKEGWLVKFTKKSAGKAQAFSQRG